MPLTRKQFLDIAGPGALGAVACSALGYPRRPAETPTCMGRRFAFHAGATALGGAFTRPFNEVIESQATSALTTVGGSDSARVENFHYRELISFRVGSTQVLGSEHAGEDGCPVFETLAYAEVEDLNVAGMVTADRVVARLTSSSTKDDSDELPMLPMGSYFENLRIAGTPIEDLQINEHLRTIAKKSRIEKACRREELPDPDERHPPRGAKGALAVASYGPRWRCSIFGDLPEGRIPGTTTRGYRIDVPDFGKVYLGELTIEANSRQLNMIRLELGSPGAGSAVVCAVQGDGRDY